MDRVNKKDKIAVWALFSGALILVLGVKAHQLNWLKPEQPLLLDDQPAVLVFVKYRYTCECEAIVNDSARAQIQNWSSNAGLGVQLRLLNIEHYSQMASKYQVIRTPAMLLLDKDGEILWRQDGVNAATSDTLPLDLAAVESVITGLYLSVP